MESDTYHNELVKLPRYEEVNYWQASGTGFSFEDVSTIDIQNAKINEGAEVKQSGIVASTAVAATASTTRVPSVTT